MANLEVQLITQTSYFDQSLYERSPVVSTYKTFGLSAGSSQTRTYNIFTIRQHQVKLKDDIFASRFNNVDLTYYDILPS